MTTNVRSILKEKSQCITLFVRELIRIPFIFFKIINSQFSCKTRIKIYVPYDSY